MTLDTYEPLGNQVLCEAFIPEKTDSGLLIPIEAQKKTRVMEAIKVGRQCEVVRAGDKVVLGDANAVVEISFGKRDFIQIPEFAIIGFSRQNGKPK